MRLFDLIEEHHGVWPAAHRLGELSTFVIADVAWRRSDQARGGVALHELAHVEPDDRVLVVEEERGECSRKLGLADAGRAEEHERPDRPLGILEARARAAHRLGDDLHGVVLADEPLVDLLLHAEQA